MVIFKADSFEETEEFCKHGPLVIEGYATYKLVSLQRLTGATTIYCSRTRR